MSRMMADKMIMDCIEAATRCANECQETTVYCLAQGGRHVEPQHMKTMLDCAEICRTCDDFMLRRSEHMREICNLCADVCETCAESCAGITGDRKMEECADTCRKCAGKCREMA